MKFVIFHGSFGNPEGNWFPQLKDNLKHLNQTVFIPTFPIDNWDILTKKGKGNNQTNQNLNNWIKAFEKQVLPKIKKSDRLIFVGHSLGPLFILHIVNKFNIKLDSAIFVSPFLRDIDNKIWQFRAVNKTFYKIDFNFKKLRKLIPISYVLCSNTDPYVGRKHFLEFGRKMNSSMIEVKNGGHLNSETGFNKFLLIFELCKTRLDSKLYQHG